MNQLYLVVTLAGERVAISAGEVESVVEVERLTPVPHAPSHVGGLTALRSRVLTAIDCRASLGLGRSDGGSTRDAIVVEQDGHAYALIVDAVEDVLEFEGEVRPVRTRLAAGWPRVARGMIECEGGFLLLVDCSAILAGPTAISAWSH